MERTSRRIVGQNDIEQDWAGVAAAPTLAKRLIIRGTVHDDTLVGTAANEVFRPRTGDDDVTGGGGNDTLVINYSNEPVLPGNIYHKLYFDSDGYLSGYILGRESRCDFADISQLKIILSDGTDWFSIQPSDPSTSTEMFQIDAGGGNDSLSLSFDRLNLGRTEASGVIVEGSSDGSVVCDYGMFMNFEDVDAFGTIFDDVITNIHGYLNGNGGDDFLVGSDGDDVLKGSLGTDTLEGGEGSDNFHYISGFNESCDQFGIDTIIDFSSAEGDLIDFGILDCDKTIRGSQRFVFIGDAEITDSGQLRSVAIGDGVYQVEGNRDADADLEFVLIVHADQPLVAADFGL